jgi:hypothetical protein
MVDTGALGGHALGNFLLGSLVLESWVFDYVNGTITVGTEDLDKTFVSTSGKQYSQVSVYVANAPSTWTSNISYIIDHDSGSTTINAGETKTIPASNNVGVRLRNISGSSFNVDMFTNIGKPILMRVEYS